MSNQIEVLEKSVVVQGESLLVSVLKMRGGEHLTYQQAAEALGTSTVNIRKAIERENLVVTKCHDQELSELKELGVLPFKTTVANLIDKEGMKVLVKVLNTPEAWAAYNQLWNVTEKAYELYTMPPTNPLDNLKAIVAAMEYQQNALKVVDKKVEVLADKTNTVIDMLGSGDSFHTVAKKSAQPEWKEIIKTLTAAKVGRELAKITKNHNLERKFIPHPAYPKGIGAYSEAAWVILKAQLDSGN